MFEITKWIEWDMGHRVPEHKSKCKNPHGHRYKIEVTIEAEELLDKGSDTGMVQDFGDIKKILMEKIHDILDHGFMISKDDDKMLEAFEIDTNVKNIKSDGYAKVRGTFNFKIIVVNFVPTAENIAKWCYEQIKDDIFKEIGDSTTSNMTIRKLKQVRVWETPTSTAIYRREK